MALVVCKECGSKVSTDAKACPSCGAKPPKRTRVGSLVVAGLASALMFSCIYTQNEADQKRAAQEAAKTPAQREAEAAAARQAQARVALAKITRQMLAQSVRDPDSLVIESLQVQGEAKHACVQYRAKNGFGGVNREQAVLVGTAFKSDAATWNRLCAGNELLVPMAEALQ